jgi:hypothetical protein
MWDVSERFLSAIRYPHKTRTTVTVTPPGGDAVTLNVKSGTVRVESTSNIRRRGNLTLEGDSADFETVATPGAVITINHGIVFGNSEELIPVFTGEIVDPRQGFGEGTIDVSLADLGQRVARNKFTTAYVPGSSTTRLDAIETVLGASAILRIRTGVQPASCAAARSGTVLATVTLPADWMTAAAAGVKALSGAWQDSAADAAGIAGHYELMNAALTICHLQGSVSITGGGGDMQVDNTNFAVGQQFIVSTFTLTDANA